MVSRMVPCKNRIEFQQEVYCRKTTELASQRRACRIDLGSNFTSYSEIQNFDDVMSYNVHHDLEDPVRQARQLPTYLKLLVNLLLHTQHISFLKYFVT